MTTMREAYEQRATDLEAKYNKKMTALRDDLELRRKTEVHEVEEVCNYIHVINLMNNYLFILLHYSYNCET